MIQELKDVKSDYNNAQIRLQRLTERLQAIYEIHPDLFSKSPKEMGASELMRIGQTLSKLIDELEKDK